MLHPVFPRWDNPLWRSLELPAPERLEAAGLQFLKLAPGTLKQIVRAAFRDAAFLVRKSHLNQLAAIINDPGASASDRLVVRALLQNLVISAEGILPMCQDTGTAIIMGWKGESLLLETDAGEECAQGVAECYRENRLRASQIAALDMYREQNTGSNLPAQVDMYAVPGNRLELLCIAKGGGSSNRTLFFQETKALLNPASLQSFLTEKIPQLGTAGCPPYHLAVVVGGTSPEANLAALKLATAGALDDLPLIPAGTGQAAPQPQSANSPTFAKVFRDPVLEAEVVNIAAACGFGAQFGGKAFALDARVIRLSRHAASLPVSIGVSCVADRNVRALVCAEGVFLERLEEHPLTALEKAGLNLHAAEPDGAESPVATVAPELDMDLGIDALVEQLAGLGAGRLVRLSGTLIVARDAAHARFLELLDSGKPLPDYLYRHPVYYAGPSETPPGMVIGSLGPTTAGRMDAALPRLMASGASRITLAKGNRKPEIAAACKTHQGFYLATIGGAAALIARDHIVSDRVIDHADLAMEAVREIRVERMPALIVCDNQGRDFYRSVRSI